MFGDDRKRSSLSGEPGFLGDNSATFKCGQVFLFSDIKSGGLALVGGSAGWRLVFLVENRKKQIFDPN